MIIQGAHLNYGSMQRPAAGRTSGNSAGSSASGAGLHLGQFMTVNPAKAGLTPARQPLAGAPGQEGKLSDNFPDTVGKAFAAEIVRRMGEMTGDDGQPKDASALEQSLGDTIDWLQGRFGEETAAAAAGMILKATASGVTEDSLGTGLLNTLKFIDRNFGFAAGDQAIARFNTGINMDVNAFFDNGHNEIFLAAEPPSDGSSAVRDLTTRMLSRVAGDGSDIADGLDELTDVLDQLKGELDRIGELQDLVGRLEDRFSPAKVSAGTASAAYEAAPGGNEPQLASLMV